MPRLIHLSDLHHQLDWSQRSLASTGWRGAPGRFELQVLGRLARFERAELRIGQLLEALHLEEPDHVLLTGDLTALGHEEELRGVLGMLGPLIDARRVTLIPGNHDRYTDSPRDRLFERVFAAQLKSDLPEYAGAEGYPFVHLIGEDLAVIGLDSTRVSGWSHYVVGQLGREQLSALDRLLDDPRLAKRTVIVLSHHGPFGPLGSFHWRESGLLDGKRLLEVLHGRPVTLHHGHSHHRYWHRADAGRPHILGGGSSTDHGSHGYWVIDIDEEQRLEAREVRLAGG